MSKSRSRAINYSASPLLASKTPVWRSKFIVAALALAFVGLGARAAYVQVFGNDFFQRQGEVRFARTLELPANRGRVLDRNGLILASSVVAQSIWAIPEDVDKTDPQLKQLAKLLELPLPELRKRLANEDKTFVWVKRQVDEPIAKEIAALGIKGIYQRREYKRQYPEGEAAAHVVGFTNVEDRGQEGVELAFNQQLSGKAGSRRVIKDRLGRVIEDVRDVIPPVDGPDLQLSIDSKVQYFAYEKLRDAVKSHKAKAGSVIVLDAQTGEVLALANYPSYNPNKRLNLSGDQLRNRVLTDSFEPGSTMKPFIAALALDKGLVKPTTQIQTAPGRISIGGSSIGDSHPHGILTVNEIIQKSSNVGTVKMAMQMHPREMWETFAQAGFGQKPQVPFPGAVTGRLRPYKSWRPIEQATMSYGYGLSVSLFQLAQAYTIFARDGELIPVSMLKSETPAVGVRVFSEKNAVSVRKMLELATGPGGTAPKAQTMGYSVGGKTGTAHKQEGKGYADKKYRSFFVGLAPVEAPRIVVAVMIDEPSNGEYFGGLVAAPVFSETVQQSLRVLGVQPDMNVKPQIVTEAVEESF
ncbi:peptidoglycan D,D-transpeptidase FtsI family protein [Hydrogenophaga sp. A37]|uniref:peptidoglycan D,D-transpeptidase FtsI family protein n=1 Tax=Hydrogenophaga sp. A37 TaxID=1945864 RepID=UPI0009863AC8|nr:penicillin-binding protein 2 [Hydrogenophaga sp. A37]OOG82466.1 cell division protein [Hydrogenophaga sp. A37]